MSSRAELSPSEVIVAPGDEESLILSVENTGATTQVFSIVPTGIAQGWISVDPATVTVLAGATENVPVVLRPPRTATVAAGSSTIGVRVVSHDDPEDVASAEGSVTVLAFHDRSVAIAQPVLRTRRRTEFDVLVENDGNSRASCRMSFLDNTGRLVGRFDPPSVGVEPGMGAAVKVEVKAKRRLWTKGSRTLPFVVQAVQDDHPTAEGHATVLQDPFFTNQFVTRLAALAATLGLFVAAWAWVVRPAITDAARTSARREINRLAAKLEADSATVPASSPADATVSVSQPNPVGNDEGVITSGSVTLLAQRDGGQSQTMYTVPVGFDLLLTDLQLGNAPAHAGRMTVSVGDKVVWSPDPARIDARAQQWVSGYRVSAGETLIAAFDLCIPGGGEAATQCTVYVSFSGVLVLATEVPGGPSSTPDPLATPDTVTSEPSAGAPDPFAPVTDPPTSAPSTDQP